MVPRWSHQVNRGMLVSADDEGRTPSVSASHVSDGFTHDAVGDIGCSGHSRASGPDPITGKADTRKRAQPIGTSSTSVIGSALRTGLCWTSSIRLLLSSCQLGMRLAFARSTIGAFSKLKGCIPLRPGSVLRL